MLSKPRKILEQEIEKLLKYELDEWNRNDLKYSQDTLIECFCSKNKAPYKPR